MEFFETVERPERAVLISVDTGDFDTEASLAELKELVRTAGAEVLGELVQKRESPDSAYFLGTGRLEELKEFCENNEIDLIIADSELTPTQQRNIEDETDIRVVDRTALILDIFASHAKSGEGKLQVELAQLKYSLTRLAGKGTQLSRLGGGIGTRGPGETKLETDRRHIRRRVTVLEHELKQLGERRERYRQKRKKDGNITVALVGYTNAGKSTLMNALTNAGVLSEDKLFATLDPTVRALTLPDGNTVMLVDTVGFVRRLPHRLVEAFKSTLDEALYADVLLNVCDASSDEYEEQLAVTQSTLNELGCENKPIISVLNKCDKAKGLYLLPKGESVRTSAITGEGLPELLEKIADALPPSRRRTRLLLPFSMGNMLAPLRSEGVVHSEEYREDGILLDVTAPIVLLEKLKDNIFTD